MLKQRVPHWFSIENGDVCGLKDIKKISGTDLKSGNRRVTRCSNGIVFAEGITILAPGQLVQNILLRLLKVERIAPSPASIVFGLTDLAQPGTGMNADILRGRIQSAGLTR